MIEMSGAVVVAGGAIGGAIAGMRAEQEARRKRLGIRYCYQCGHEWVSKSKTVKPNICPLCKSPKWDDNSEYQKKDMSEFKRFLTKVIIAIIILSVVIYLVFPVGGFDFLPLLWVGGTLVVMMRLFSVMSFD